MPFRSSIQAQEPDTRVADAAKVGKPWDGEELDAIVADYFAMLDAELAGRKYVKSAHSSALMARIGRTHRSVEFKHQNISAALDELGMPWIRGYIPKRNYQNAIVEAIDRYLSRNPAAFEWRGEAARRSPGAEEVFVAPPELRDERAPAQKALHRLLGKFDPAARDQRNRSLGEAGESFVFELERRRLEKAARPDLAKKVRWVAAEEGDGAGFDVLSFNAAGQERLLEVKTTNGSARTPFFLTRNEYAVANERPADWRIYRVHQFADQPRIFTIAPPLHDAVRLRPETWCASFR